MTKHFGSWNHCVFPGASSTPTQRPQSPEEPRLFTSQLKIIIINTQKALPDCRRQACPDSSPKLSIIPCSPIIQCSFLQYAVVGKIVNRQRSALDPKRTSVAQKSAASSQPSLWSQHCFTGENGTQELFTATCTISMCDSSCGGRTTRTWSEKQNKHRSICVELFKQRPEQQD